MKSILSDIFPDNKCTTPPPPESPIRQAIFDACTAQNTDSVNATKYFVEKVYQLYEMLHIRAGIMIVGDSFSGKTTTYRILTKALAILEKQQQQQQEKGKEQPTTEIKEGHPVCTIINPKSVTIGQLYGQFDTNHEWRDGILAINFKHFINANDECKRREWIIFDGPVDTVWMEALNSVLDDNRKLCLTSGDIFYMNCFMNLIFETSDLADASPAIVKTNFLFHFSHTN